MKRHDWAARMYEVIDAHADKSFEWGVNDCCLFAARVRDAMTDSSIETAILLQYHSEGTAMEFISQYGGLLEVVSEYLGPPVNERATRGDVVMIHGGIAEALGICIGSQVVAMGEKGLRSLPRSEIIAVWKV